MNKRVLTGILAIILLFSGAIKAKAVSYHEGDAEEYIINQIAKETTQNLFFWEFGQLYVKKYFSEESKKEMIRVLAVENGLIEDTDKDVKSLDKYFKDLGI